MEQAGNGAEQRRRAARVLAGAATAELDACWAAWPEPPAVDWLRSPEPGLVMVQGRIGGTGDRFNLGEATVTRATARLEGGGLAAPAVGTAYVLGSDTEHAGLAAIFTALLADQATREAVLARVIAPLEAAQLERDRAARDEARSTVVDFLTVARENAGAAAAEAGDGE